MNRAKSRRLLLLGAVLGLLCAGTGCGKKDWPAPIADQERFVWTEVSTEIQGRCLQITALLSGKVENLAALTLELEFRDEPCPGCPFVPSTRVRMEAGSKRWERRGGLVTVTWCGLPQDQAVRWRLIGHPIHATMADVPSEVYNLQ